MQITYDPQADVLAIRLRAVDPERGREVAPDLIVETDAAGEVVALELLNARGHVGGDPLSVGLQLLVPEASPATRLP